MSDCRGRGSGRGVRDGADTSDQVFLHDVGQRERGRRVQLQSSAVITVSALRRVEMNANGKRTAAVLLGTDWAAEADVAPAEDCACTICVRRAPKPEEVKEQWRRTEKRAFLCKARCNGDRVAGDGKFTTCKRRGKISVCHGCMRVIEPVWALSKEERERLAAEGHSYESVVLMNREVQKTLEWVSEAGGIDA